MIAVSASAASCAALRGISAATCLIAVELDGLGPIGFEFGVVLAVEHLPVAIGVVGAPPGVQFTSVLADAEPGDPVGVCIAMTLLRRLVVLLLYLPGLAPEVVVLHVLCVAQQLADPVVAPVAAPGAPEQPGDQGDVGDGSPCFEQRHAGAPGSAATNRAICMCMRVSRSDQPSLERTMPHIEA